jgi:hypothetical protein
VHALKQSFLIGTGFPDAATPAATAPPTTNGADAVPTSIEPPLFVRRSTTPCT